MNLDILEGFHYNYKYIKIKFPPHRPFLLTKTVLNSKKTLRGKIEIKYSEKCTSQTISKWLAELFTREETM